MRGHGGSSREARARVAARWASAAAIFASVAAVGAEAQTLASLPRPGAVHRIDSSGGARPVQGWVKFCERQPAECDLNTAEPAFITLSAKTWRTLNTVNRHVNASIRPKTDMEHWGVVDRWDIPDDGAGDCEDYQLLKRKILVEQHGLPRRALRMTVVIDDQGEGHAVMMVRTDEGELILDNKRSAILPWHETGYVFVKREGQDGRDWVSLGDRTSPTTTANR